jgi:hypothetical protein
MIVAALFYAVFGAAFLTWCVYMVASNYQADLDEAKEWRDMRRAERVNRK